MVCGSSMLRSWEMRSGSAGIVLAQSKYRCMSIDIRNWAYDIIEKLEGFSRSLVENRGGNPLAQAQCEFASCCLSFKTSSLGPEPLSPDSLSGQ